jgi:hypothetical protein
LNMKERGKKKSPSDLCVYFWCCYRKCQFNMGFYLHFLFSHFSLL